MRFDVKLTGVDHLLKRLFSLKQGMRNVILRRALRAGAKPVWLGARHRAKAGTRELRRSLGTRMKSYRRGGVVVIVIGPRSKNTIQHPPGSLFPSYTRGYNPARYAHLHEKGTKPHKIPIKRGRLAGVTVRHPGTKPTLFMIGAWVFSQGRVKDKIVHEIRQGLFNVAVRGKP
jgi:HK97 gp10 family phage protein